jgi:soluble lytic murein transglycosylase-like protein
LGSIVRSSRSRSTRFVPLAFLLVPLLLGAVSRPSNRPGGFAPIPGTSDRAALTYAEAAAAVRARDCAGAFRALGTLTAGKDRDAAFAKLLTGFYAHACEQEKLAEERLFHASDPDGLLEDWRLYLLSDAAEAQGHVLLSQASLARLIGDHPASALRPRALVKAATLAWGRNDVNRALELIDRARRDHIAGEEAVRLERLAWEIGNRTGNEEVRREAARHLLTEAPAVASELKVVDIFRPSAGNLDWSLVLSPEQLKRRASVLLELKLDPSATASLDAVPLAARDLEWYLLKARSLTRAKRGGDALELLAGRAAAEPRLAAQLEWERSQAAADLATAQRGRTSTAADRQRMRQLSQQYLQKAAQAGVQTGGDPELAGKALRSLWTEQIEDDRFDEAIRTLRRLRELDPSDTSGAAHLWSLGWREYGKANYSGAVGYWTELFSLYPEVSDGRRGRYWTARAFEALGEAERAQQIYREVASSDTRDLYSKNAVARLGGRAVPAQAEEGAPEAWPADPQLARARLLTDLGLEGLAQTEMELVRNDAEPRSLRALEALILARKGERRKSILVIRDAFPALGTPHQARLPDEARRLYYPLDYQDTVRSWAARNSLPTNLVFGIIRQESAFDTQAQSWAGARGLMQLMPATARELAGRFGLPYSHEKLSDPEFNIRLGTSYFSQVLDMFEGNQELALAGYNGGPYRIKRWWKEWGTSDIDRFLESLSLEESRIYVKRIVLLSDSYRQLYPQPPV